MTSPRVALVDELLDRGRRHGWSPRVMDALLDHRNAMVKADELDQLERIARNS